VQESDGLEVAVAVVDKEAVAVGERVALDVTDGVMEGVCVLEAEEDWELVGVPLWVGCAVRDAVADADWLADGDGVGLLVTKAEGETVHVGVVLLVGVGDGVALRVGVADRLGDAVRLGVPLLLGEDDALLEGVAETDLVGDIDGLGVAPGVREGEAERDGVGDADGVGKVAKTLAPRTVWTLLDIPFGAHQLASGRQPPLPAACEFTVTAGGRYTVVPLPTARTPILCPPLPPEPFPPSPPLPPPPPRAPLAAMCWPTFPLTVR